MCHPKIVLGLCEMEAEYSVRKSPQIGQKPFRQGCWEVEACK